VAAAKKVKNALGRGNASRRLITKLEQSIFSSDIYGCETQPPIETIALLALPWLPQWEKVTFKKVL
jgi:hypothetical protein